MHGFWRGGFLGRCGPHSRRIIRIVMLGGGSCTWNDGFRKKLNVGLQIVLFVLFILHGHPVLDIAWRRHCFRLSINQCFGFGLNVRCGSELRRFLVFLDHPLPLLSFLFLIDVCQSVPLQVQMWWRQTQGLKVWGHWLRSGLSVAWYYWSGLVTDTIIFLLSNLICSPSTWYEKNRQWPHLSQPVVSRTLELCTCFFQCCPVKLLLGHKLFTITVFNRSPSICWNDPLKFEMVESVLLPVTSLIVALFPHEGPHAN